ncbi:MAG TPA: sigma-70 family RNA polymerase sigma factor [Polyangiales bacterium]|jgi:RNA polymerase sigma factor for flagellar operon FliA|nr:sigma-70 family RNA polymerase sigma factor [Polyangiales bacterium]
MTENEQFVREYDGFVRGVATHTRAQLALDTPIEDLVAFGFQGLLDARRRFDSSKGVPFRSFAYYRVRGAMLDGVRAMARLPRRAYARLRAAEAVDQLGEATAESLAGQRPSPEFALRAVDAVLGRVAAAYTVAVTAEDSEAGAGSPEEALLREERLRHMHGALERLPEREQRMIRGHYFEGRRFDDVAAELGISKSWASRVHAHALDLLRKALAGADNP